MSSNPPLIWQFDVATRTGWAVYSAAEERMVASGSVRLAERTEEIGAKAKRLWTHLRNMRGDYGTPDIVGFEQPLLPNGRGKVTVHTARPGIALCGVVELFAEMCSARSVELPQASWRKLALGVGGGKDSDEWKAMSIAQAKAWGFAPEDDNEADAICQMDALLHACRIRPPWQAELRLFVEEAPKRKAARRNK